MDQQPKTSPLDTTPEVDYGYGVFQPGITPSMEEFLKDCSRKLRKHFPDLVSANLVITLNDGRAAVFWAHKA
jgi:hypothetical protein